MKLLNGINKILARIRVPKTTDKFENILVVSNTGLGDTLLSLPAIQTLRQSFPQLKITFMVDYKMFPLFKSIRYVDDFIIYRSGIISQIRLVKEIRQRKIDTIFLFHSNGPEDIFFSLLSGAGKILKMTHNQNHPYRTLFVNTPVDTEQHETISRIELVKCFSPTKIVKRMDLEREHLRILDDTFEALRHCKHLIGFQVGAQDTYKMWPIENFIMLAKRLIEIYPHYCIVLLGSTRIEYQLTDDLVRKVDMPSNIINLCGKTGLDELPAVLKKLDVLVTNDTGTMHLAIALQVKTLSLFGPTNPILFGPNQDLHLHTIIYKKMSIDDSDRDKSKWEQGLMNKISVDEVYMALQKILDQS